MTSSPSAPSTLALVPGKTGQQLTFPGTGANTEPDPARLPGDAVLFAHDTALTRAGDGYFAWLDHIWSAAGCSAPVRLHGQVHTVDTHTGQVLSTLPTSALPDAVIYKACGNRRVTVCPSCAETYRRDAYQLVRSGLAGGKGVSESVSTHPAVFATFTAPTFGPVHTRHVRVHTCSDKTRCTCRPEPCHARRNIETCPHGVPQACFARHEPTDQRIGQPLCLDCYDHDHHVVWNNQAGELWRRTKQAAERHLNQLARRRGLPRIRIAHGKAAEYQRRGAVHFHVLLRLDGTDPDDPTAVIPPPDGLTVADLQDAVEHAATATGFTTLPHAEKAGGWPIAWGDQLDVRPLSLRGDNPVTDAMVAAYLAKYATKGTEVTGHTSRRLDHASIEQHADRTGTHTERLIAACWDLGHPDHLGFDGLRRWAHMLGFGGHFFTKARRYSTTFAALRAARVRYRRAQDIGREYTADAIERQADLDEETTLVIGDLTYAGSGWKTTGDALLANTAAAQAREYNRAGREELAYQQACSSSTPLAA
ncbi:replication initiator [Sphaerisporangium perillae]|uniref:replication initiator n=1 Tax=Sphaerisporangium perillae TaxID=2935860 RepID=UPI00200E82F2|nr:replication initiator [Sphaerisporangium perillae]